MSLDNKAVPQWTIDGFEQMTKQALFDMAATHLLTQGRQSRGMKFSQLENKLIQSCLYNGPEGLTCGAGIFLKPEFRADADKYGPWWDVVNNQPEAMPKKHQAFVHEVQHIHDGWKPGDKTFKEHAKDGLYKLAKVYHLKTDVLRKEFKAA
jgi:hypothetical protein